MLDAPGWIRGAGAWLASRLSSSRLSFGAWAAPSSLAATCPAVSPLPLPLLTASLPPSHRLAPPCRYSTSLKTGKNKWFFQKLRF